jgi:hypothetical protein
MLVAECPRRVQLLCHKLFEFNDASGRTFACHPDIPTDTVLPLIAHIPGLSSSLCPHRLSKRSQWTLPRANAPNKSREKPDSRRPLIDRSHCPTACLDTPASRAVDFLASVFLPEHMHIDLQRTDDFVILVRDFNRLPPHGRVHSSGGDLESCFTNIPHQLVWSAWNFTREIIAGSFTSVIAPKRGRKGLCRTSHEDSGPKDFFLVFSLTDLEILIDHELESGWFLLGLLVCRQVAGLPMGSPWGGALTRLVLIYCDIVFYRSLHTVPIGIPSQRGRISRCRVFGVDILVLEVRYVDDYHSLWKGPVSLPLCTAAAIDSIIRSRVLQRYPLPLKPDEGQRFVGINLSCCGGGTVSTRPAIQHCPQYREIYHSNFMHFSSFVPRSIKRAVVLGMISRISSYTVPDMDKPSALLEAMEMLRKVCGFPVSFLRRCAEERSQSEPWIFDVRWSTLE